MSSRAITPRRRSRSSVDLDDEKEETRIEDNGSTRSNGNKRMRSIQGSPTISLDSDRPLMRDDAGSEEANDRYEASGSPERPLLPRSYLRSPRALPTASFGRESAPKHQPGAIVRVTLKNFVTYTNAEFKPGPNLNMIIGPNGTGKSTLVCAICLGLGWKTQHLGRAKDISEFVKHSERTATIEIELAADPSRHRSNPVITTKIMRDANKAEYAIDARKVSGKALQELMKSFSIQVDNLCQFLPQDRVVEFAALSPVDLLAQTQKAAAPEQMTIWHEELKTKRREQKTREQRRAELETDIKNMQNRQRLQEADVARLRERTMLQDRFVALDKLRPFPDYVVAKSKHAEGKERKKDAERELKRLTRRMEPNLKAVEEKKEYTSAIANAKHARLKLIERTYTHIQSIQQNHTKFEGQIKDHEKELQSEKDLAKKYAQEKPRHQGNVQRIEHALQNPPPECDTVAANAKINEASAEIRGIESKASELTESMNSLMEQARQRQRMLAELEEQRERLQTQVGQQGQKLKAANPEVARAWEWMQTNRDKFEGEIFGPAILECTVKNENHAAAVEAAIGGGDLFALTVTTQKDFRMLYEQVYTSMKLQNVNVRTSNTPLSDFRSPLSSEQRQALGLECFLIDLIEGPDAVLAMLCDNRNLHASGFTSRAISQTQYEALLESNLGAWSTTKERNTVARRREYGDQGNSVRSIELRPARFFKDGPIEHHEDGENRRKEAELRDQIRELQADLASKKNTLAELREQCKPIEEKRDALQVEKNARQTAQSQFRGLPVKLEQAQQKLNDIDDKIKEAQKNQLRIAGAMDKDILSKGQSAIDLANATNQLKSLYNEVFEAEIAFIEAESDVEQLEQRHQQEYDLLRVREAEVKALTEEVRALLLRGKDLQEQCQAIGADLSADEEIVYAEVKEWSPDQLETEIQSVQARVEMTNGAGNQHMLREYEERAQTLEKRHEQYNKLTERLEELAQEISMVREQWEPQLDDLVQQISDAFADNFAKIQCAGEVAIHKDEDFENWEVQIKVKFRENEQLSVLDSHRQSGGERAVSTIFYLMALQSLARAPFRVVDEINQGMDPRNERLVHSRMVDIACAENSASQYFLITPKLLSGLKYHPSMKVHCIASGEFVPEDHHQLDFAQLAQKALAVRTAQLASAAY